MVVQRVLGVSGMTQGCALASACSNLGLFFKMVVPFISFYRERDKAQDGR
jgi:cephalosporin-C deacetylase-like acetyl esterase